MELKQWNDILAVKTTAGQYLGYHTQTLDVAELSEEIWNGISNQTLEQDADAFEQLKAWNEEKFENPVSAKSNNPTPIDTITINVNQLCNLHCTYCAAGGDGSYGDKVKNISVEKTLPQLGYLLSKLSPSSSFQITYLGGEPLLYPEGIKLIAAYLNEKGPELGIAIRHRIVTNGTLLNPENCELLASIKAHVAISLDGPAEINDKSRPLKNGASSTALVLEGIANLNKVRNRISSLRISGVFNRKNLDLVSAYKFFRELNPDAYDFNLDHDETDPALSLQYGEQLGKVFELAYTNGGEAELRKITSISRIFSNLDNKKRVQNYCGAGKNFVMIDSKNNVFPCVWSPNDPKKAIGSGVEILDSNRLQFQKPLIEKKGCETCWAKHLCGGGCTYVHERVGQANSMPAEVFCVQSRYLISLAISYYVRCRQ